MSQVESVLAAVRAEGRGALVGYLPIGFPSLDESVEAAVTLVTNGVDVLELGVPYSDPVMDGLVIQEATNAALENGFRLRDVFEAVRRVRERVSAPVLVMTYWNPVVQYGVEQFARDLSEAGGAGLITPDLIPDEAGEWLDASERYGLDRVFLVAPSSPDARLGSTIVASRGFVYTVSTMGITGTRSDMDNAARDLVSRLRKQNVRFACVGVGVSTEAHVREVLSYADGAIVGSALVAALRDDGIQGLARLTQSLASGTRPEPTNS